VEGKLMGVYAKPPPAPKYGEFTDAMRASMNVANTQRDAMIASTAADAAWQKQITEQVIAPSLKLMDEQRAIAAKEQARYEGDGRAAEDRIFADAASFNTEERKAQESGRAIATVATAFDANTDAARRRLAPYMDQGTLRAGALELQTSVQRAMAQAGVGNLARTNVEDRGRALNVDAANLGASIQNRANTAQAISLGAGQNAAQSAQRAAGVSADLANAPLAWAGAGQNAITGGANITNVQYGNQLARYNALPKVTPMDVINTGMAVAGMVAGIPPMPKSAIPQGSV
jgi:hypothetical protein